MAAMLQVADDAKAIAARLIPQFHPYLSGATILFLFTDKRRKKCDRVKLGSAAKMNDLQKFLSSGLESVESGYDYLIILDANEWAFMSNDEQSRLVDHELCHCKVFVKSGKNWVRLPDGSDLSEFADWKYGVVGHDIEEFAEIIGRYGLRRKNESDQEVVQAVQQALPGLRKIEAVA